MLAGEILGLHHIKIPVTDLPTSRSWYERVFDLEVLTEFRDDEDGVVRGVSYHAMGDLTLCLRENAPAAKGFAGFDPFLHAERAGRRSRRPRPRAMIRR
jgi:catechol 2,3-dioxygenase-like lactoylglutathione lyase family enzyme